MRKRTFHLALIFLLSLTAGGCVAQQDMVLTGGDAIKAATGELRAGVALYDGSVKASIGRVKAQVYAAAVTEFGKAPAAPGSDTPEQKAASLLKAIDNILLEEQRRNELRAVMEDNLAFIEKVASDMQKATIYSASIDAQVKDWIKSQLNVKKAVSTAATPSVKE